MSISRRVAGLATVTGLLVGSLLWTAPPAQAATNFTCASTLTLSNPMVGGSPGSGLINNLTKSVTYTLGIEYTNCTGDVAGGAKSGTAAGTVTFTGTCLSALAPGNGTIQWKKADGTNLNTSTFTIAASLVTTTGASPVTTVLNIGQITAGRFLNAMGTAPRADVGTAPQNCIGGNPVDTASATGQFVLIGL